MKGKHRSLPRGAQGMASIVVVSVLIIIMTLITVGFARLVNRAAVNSANKQFSASATYAAQSGINDVAAYLKSYVKANPTSQYLPQSTSCNGNGSLIGNHANQGPFYNATSLAGSSSSTKYTCILLNPLPPILDYTVDPFKSQVVKVNTTASPGALDKLLLSWQPSCDPAKYSSCPTGYPSSSLNLSDQTAWNSVPMLRVAIFPISNGEALSSTQGQSKTVFLYPQAPGAATPPVAFSSLGDGSLIPVPCSQSLAPGSFNPQTVDYKCNFLISSLSSAIAPASTDSVYLRFTSMYGQSDIQVAANDKFGNSLNMVNDQAIVDVTAQTSGVVKRLQARINTSGLAGTTGVNNNISSGDDSIPEQSLRSANAICKREVLVKPSLPGYPNYVYFDDPDAVCHDPGSGPSGGPSANQVPSLAFSIVGNDGPDINKRVCSTGDSPETVAWGCTSAANPESGQPGTVYVGSSATLYWSTINATSCTATGGWTTANLNDPGGIGASGSQSFSGIAQPTEYDITCSRLGGPSSTPTKKVIAWPTPVVQLCADTSGACAPSSSPAPLEIADKQPATLKWIVKNVSSCNPTSNPPLIWSGGPTSNGSDQNTTKALSGGLPGGPGQDYTFTINCSYPLGATTPVSVTVHVDPPTSCVVGSPGCGLSTDPGGPGGGGSGSTIVGFQFDTDPNEDAFLLSAKGIRYCAITASDGATIGIFPDVYGNQQRWDLGPGTADHGDIACDGGITAGANRGGASAHCDSNPLIDNNGTLLLCVNDSDTYCTPFGELDTDTDTWSGIDHEVTGSC